MAGPLDLSATATFSGGTIGNWSFTYNTGDPSLYLQSITIDLSPTDLAFDTYPGGFGSLTSQDISAVNLTGGATLQPGYLNDQALDGGTTVTFSFLDFTPGDVFTFTADVDHPNPTLLSLTDCSGKKGLALAACNLTNAGITATNQARLLAAQTVGPNQMAGALVTFTFGDGDGPPIILTGTFQQVTLREIINGLVSGQGAGAFDTNADAQVPEPASMATFGTGLGLLLALAVRRRRALR